jgi:hypothetical protein
MVLLGVLAALPAAAAEGRTQNATYYKFLVHVDANKEYGANCRYYEWSHPYGFCRGSSTPSGDSHSMRLKSMTVTWCAPDDTLCSIYGKHEMPKGYVRWMKFCASPHENTCQSWLLGAVHMPNGPFHVIDGVIDGHTVHADSGDARYYDTNGGPLHLVVNYTGSIHNGGGKAESRGYTFGLIGKVKF